MDKSSGKKKFLNQPKYPGGKTALSTFIKKNMVYPAAAQKKGTEGTVIVRYGIGKDGVVTEAKVISKVGDGCDEEALRLVKLLKFEIPKNRGVRALFHKRIQIHFRLKKEVVKTPAKSQPAIQYHYKKSKGGGKCYVYSVEV